MASESSHPNKKRKRRRRATVYDAVAGRVGYEGFLSESRPSKYRDTTSTSSAALPPEEILFRQKHAPLRYEEDDIYFAERHLESHEQLPDSDLLKAIHAYASDLYSAPTEVRSATGFWSLDETALLALGILLEEAAAEGLGETECDALLEQSQQSQSVEAVAGEK